MTDKPPDPELVAWFTSILGAGEEPDTWSSMMAQVAEDCMRDFDGAVPGAGGCCEVGGDDMPDISDKKPYASPFLIQKAIKAGWTEEQIREKFNIPELPDEEIAKQVTSQFLRCLGIDEDVITIFDEEQDDEEGFNATELGILKVGIDYLITDHYANQDMLRQSLEELSNKLDKMIDGATQREGKALALWKRWFEYNDFPWEAVDGFFHCFFCGDSDPNHEPDCIYLAAKELIEDDSRPDR